ncbi:hypothetical protein [Caldanaerovirga acetigignens]|jgi:hypothetical protein|uniref:hypothetical protein n=1 Tax=Caldanaerovirga acetigignens TaxID=447595 RepID=UPI0009353BA9|nr:hypothetical protein [Caldanaerovirga acetigignens]
MESRLPYFMAMFMLSGFLFSLEFLFTRIFSFLVWYHFAFIIISTAILGPGLGGLWVRKGWPIIKKNRTPYP